MNILTRFYSFLSIDLLSHAVCYIMCSTYVHTLVTCTLTLQHFLAFLPTQSLKKVRYSGLMPYVVFIASPRLERLVVTRRVGSEKQKKRLGSTASPVDMDDSHMYTVSYTGHCYSPHILCTCLFPRLRVVPHVLLQVDMCSLLPCPRSLSCTTCWWRVGWWRVSTATTLTGS